jgi:hypothetical protein
MYVIKSIEVVGKKYKTHRCPLNESLHSEHLDKQHQVRNRTPLGSWKVPGACPPPQRNLTYLLIPNSSSLLCLVVNFILKDSHGVSCSASGYLCSTWSLWYLFTLLSTDGCHHFYYCIVLNCVNILQIYFSIWLLMGIWIVSSLGHLWIVVPWAVFVHIFGAQKIWFCKEFIRSRITGS